MQYLCHFNTCLMAGILESGRSPGTKMLNRVSGGDGKELPEASASQRKESGGKPMAPSTVDGTLHPPSWEGGP